MRIGRMNAIGTRRVRPSGSRRGAAAVEFAVVAPLLFLLILGIIEIGRMMMVQQVVTNAAREGCRKAVLAGATEDQVYAVIDNYLTGSGISGHTRAVSPSLTGATMGEAVTVTVRVSYDNVTWLPLGAVQWMKGKQLQASVVMRKEAS
jgi:Flp pilus assembly protein TadG